MKKRQSWQFPSRNVGFSIKRLNKLKRKIREHNAEIAKTPEDFLTEEQIDEQARNLLK